MAGLVVVRRRQLRRGVRHRPGPADRCARRDGSRRRDDLPATLSLLTGRFRHTQGARTVHRIVGVPTAGMAIALGPIVGGYLLDRYQWSSVFYTPGPAPRSPSRSWRSASRYPQPACLGASTWPGSRVGRLSWPCWCTQSSKHPTGGWTSTSTTLRLRRQRRPASPHSSWPNGARPSPCSTSDCSPTCASARPAASVTVASFTLFGFIFLMTQFFQFVRAYSPLSTGVHLLPGRQSRSPSARLSTPASGASRRRRAAVTAGLSRKDRLLPLGGQHTHPVAGATA